MKIKLPKFLIKMTGDIHLSKYPIWVSYKPAHHKVKGREVRKILDVIKNGDILLRRYDGYLNTIFTPGFWGHAGLYIGENWVIHAIGVGVIKEDVLEFCRSDSVCVLRVRNSGSLIIEKAIEISKHLEEERVGYDYEFVDDNKNVYCTEMINKCFNNLFNNDYEEIAGNSVITPDGIRYSKEIDTIMEIKH